MGQEISSTHFSQADFDSFYQHLDKETALLANWISNGHCSDHPPVAGFEIEAWLVDNTMQAAPANKKFLQTFNNPLATAELAKFNIEINNIPVALSGKAFSQLHTDLTATWEAASTAAQAIDCQLLMIGTLPTLQQSALNLGNMSELKRYTALNDQVTKLRGEPLHLKITGKQTLAVEHDDVMLESATTSFQVHIQTPLNLAHHYYNAALIASAPLVAISANSPFLFGKDLWCETRIPLFEQAVDIGGYDGAAHGPVKRVSFGTQYARHSIMELFQLNLEHFPILLPMQFADASHLEHLRLHNGTIWRWNRPLVGFDADNTPHIRIEHRVIPAGPTIVDSIANAAFFYGLVTTLLDHVIPEPCLAFSQAKDNFYQAARYGLDTQITWLDGRKQRLQTLVADQLIDMAYQGLQTLGINAEDASFYLSIIDQRNNSGQTGSQWQRLALQHCHQDFSALTAAYLRNQQRATPVHQWELP